MAVTVSPLYSEPVVVTDPTGYMNKMDVICGNYTADILHAAHKHLPRQRTKRPGARPQKIMDLVHYQKMLAKISRGLASGFMARDEALPQVPIHLLTGPHSIPNSIATVLLRWIRSDLPLS
jgi:hypothetical protein